MHVDCDHFLRFEYTLLDSSRLSMDPDFVRGAGMSTHRVSPMILQLQLGTTYCTSAYKQRMLSWLKEANMPCNE